MKGRGRRVRWRDDNRDGICDGCRQFLDNCQCVCPFCGQSAACECMIGADVLAGGD